MRRVPKLVWSLAACLLCIVVTAAVCFIRADKGVSSDKYLEVINVLKNNFYQQTDTTQYDNAAATAMVNSLEDEWSYYLTPDEYAAYQRSSANKCIGIGVMTEFSEKYGYLSVTSVQSGSPADIAHIKVGNMIAAVDGMDVDTFSPEQLDSLLESYYFRENEKDRSFTLQLLNPQGGRATATMQCELIYVEPCTSYVLDGTSIGYIKISNFDDSAASSLKNAVDKLTQYNVRSLIIDLRDNCNGKPAELAEALDYMLPKCDLFALSDKNGTETLYSSGNSCVTLPVILLVNENTACAAEMFAFCMQTNGNATVVGRRTKADSKSQTVVELSDGSAIRISKYLYLTPDKKSMEELGGVTPNISSSQIDDSDMDVQLEAAKDVAE